MDHPPRAFPSIRTSEIPASVPFRLVLAHTDNLALWMSHVRVYSGGMTFSIDACQRGGDRLLGIYGFGKPEAGQTPPMLFGIEDSAGTISTNLPGSRSGLRPNGGGGGVAGQTMHYSLAPLPAPGPMAVYISWPHFGIAETRFEVDATAIRDAAAEVISLWPPGDVEPGMSDPDDWTTPQLEVPAGGWFEAAAGKRKLLPPDPSALRRINFGHAH